MNNRLLEKLTFCTEYSFLNVFHDGGFTRRNSCARHFKGYWDSLQLFNYNGPISCCCRLSLLALFWKVRNHAEYFRTVLVTSKASCTIIQTDS
jgi:hypothetical protein